MNKVLQAAIANTSMASYMSRYSRTSTESGSACNDSLVVPSFTIHASGGTSNEGSFNYQSFSPSKNENISPSNNETEPSAKPWNIHCKSTDSQNSNTEFDATTDNIKPTKCAIKACPKYSAGAEKVMCTRNGCGRIIHQLCSDRLVITQHKLFPLEGCYFCTKSCYGKFERDTLSLRLTWENDGKNGRNDPNTSANLLVNWLANQNNYNLWRGDTSGERMGLTKTEIATNLAKMLNDSGVNPNCAMQNWKYWESNEISIWLGVICDWRRPQRARSSRILPWISFTEMQILWCSCWYLQRSRCFLTNNDKWWSWIWMWMVHFWKRDRKWQWLWRWYWRGVGIGCAM